MASIESKFKVKNGLLTQNTEFTSPNETQAITVSMLDSGALSFSGSAGQLFSITDSLTGTIFGVNDISGVPSIEVDDDGTIRFAEFDGNVLIGTNTDNGVDKLQIEGSISATRYNNDGFLGSSQLNAKNHFTQFNIGNSAITQGWIAGAFGDATEDRVVIGQTNTGAIIGAHNSDLTAWSTLFINPNAVSTARVVIGNTADNGIDRLQINGDVSATNFKGSLIGNATTASRWQTARTITLAGDLTGSVSIDGSANVTLSAQVVNDSHTHDTRYYTEAEADARFFNVTGDTITGEITFTGSASRSKIDFNNADAHTLGWESFHNTYGPNTWNSGVVGHKFYGNSGTVIATIGTGGSSGNTNSIFNGQITATQFNGPLNGKAADADLYDGVDSITFASSLRSHSNMTGGGTITVSSSNELSWSQRFIIISNSRGTTFSTTGYFDINQPPSGTVITGVGGAPNTTVTANGVPLNVWYALYYILPIGGTNTTVNANFRIVNYTSNIDIPSNWVLIALRSGDNGKFRISTGITLGPSESYNSGVYTSHRVPRADTWTTARTITLAGDLTGSVSINGSANVTLSAQVVNDSHTHDGRYYTEAESDARFVNVTGDTMSGTLISTASTGFRVDVPSGNALVEIDTAATGNYAFVRQRSGASFWDIAIRENEFTGSYQFRPQGQAPVFRIERNGNLKVGVTASAFGSAAITGELDRFIEIGVTEGTGTGQASNFPSASGIVFHHGGISTNSLKYVNTASQAGYFEFKSDDTSYDLRIGGQRVFADNYHPNADTLTTARTISLSGDATGSVSFNGSANVTIPVVVANDSHTHDTRYYTEAESDARFANVTGDIFTGGVDVNFNNGNPHFIARSTGAGTGDFNYVLRGDNNTGTKAVHFINSSARTTDGGVNTYTIRNDGGALRLGRTSQQTQLEGNSFTFTGGNVTLSNDLTVNGGDIILGGTGRIQGVDTVSATTDATNKSYVDAADATKVSKAGDTITGTLTIANEGGLVFDQTETGGGGYIPRPGGAYYNTTTATITGACRIAFPAGTAPSDMLSFHVDIYDYNANESVTLYVYGYNRGPGASWVNTGALVLSDRTDRDYTVRFGRDTTNTYVYIAETNSTWSYPQVVVRDFQVGFTADINQFATGWDIAFVTAFATIDATATDNYPVAKQFEIPRNIALTGDVTGNVNFDGSANVSIATTIAANSVALGTDTTGNYVGTVAAGAGIVVSGANGEGVTKTVAHADTSAQASVNNANGTVIQDITLDGFGHLTAIGSVNLDTRYPVKNVGYTWTATGANALSFQSLDVLETATSDQAALEVYQDTAGADAFMQFHVAGDFAAYFGLKGDINDFAIGGWSMGNVFYRVFHDNYHPNADKWTTARTITLGGDLTGSVSIDGSANVTLSAQVVNDSHTHDGRYYTEAESNALFFNVSGDTITGQLISTRANNAGTNAGQIFLNGANGNRIDWNTNGVAAPAFTTRSAGTKLVLYPQISASAVDYAFGIESNTLWSSVPTTTQQFKWYAGTTNIMTLAGNGNLTASGDVTAFSDIRIKTDIKNIENALDKVKQIRGVTFKRKEGENSDKVHAGVIAQEVEKVLPEVVSENEDGIKSVAYGNMVSILIEAIKEQQEQIEELKSHINRDSIWKRIIKFIFSK